MHPALERQALGSEVGGTQKPRRKAETRLAETKTVPLGWEGAFGGMSLPWYFPALRSHADPCELPLKKIQTEGKPPGSLFWSLPMLEGLGGLQQSH